MVLAWTMPMMVTRLIGGEVGNFNDGHEHGNGIDDDHVADDDDDDIGDDHVGNVDVDGDEVDDYGLGGDHVDGGKLMIMLLIMVLMTQAMGLC